MKKYFTIQLFTSCRINTKSIVSGIRCTLRINVVFCIQGGGVAVGTVVMVGEYNSINITTGDNLLFY
jgi:hypothetical protein